MHNDLLTIGSFTIHGYGLMTAIGIITAYFLMEYRAKKKGLDADRVFWLLIWCLIFGYLGSKLLYFITIMPSIIEDPSVILSSLSGGWVIYGGLIGGMLGGYLYCRYKKLDAWAYFDLGFVSVIIAQAFGRIGCLLAGCCYGIETDASYGIIFTESQFAPNNVSLFPTQILMSVGDFALFAILLIYDRVKKREGLVTGLYLMLYSAGRFAIEFVRGDVARGSVGPLSTSQFIAIFIFIIGAVIFISRRKCAASKETENEDVKSENVDVEDGNGEQITDADTDIKENNIEENTSNAEESIKENTSKAEESAEENQADDEADEKDSSKDKTDEALRE